MLRQGLIALSMMAVTAFSFADETASLQQVLKKMLPGTQIEQLKPVENTGLYEGVVNGQVVYFTADGAYVLQGDLVALDSRINLTEQRRISLRKDIINGFEEKDLIIFEPKKADYTLTVFTDIDCGYCRKLHGQMKEYNDLGIRVRYAAFPRGGLNSASYDETVSVWCAKDRHKAMTQAKQGKEIEQRTCTNPVKAQFELGQKLGVTGTPSMFLDNGQMLPGYVEPKKLRQILDEHSGQS